MPSIYLDLIGKDFKLGSRGPEFFDCWGLCLEVGKRAGILYPEEFTPDETENQSEAVCAIKDRDFVRIEEAEPYCVVTFKITPPFVDHCGIVLPDCRTFFHTMQGHHASVNRLSHRVLVKRIEGFYKLRTV